MGLWPCEVRLRRQPSGSYPLSNQGLQPSPMRIPPCARTVAILLALGSIVATTTPAQSPARRPSPAARDQFDSVRTLIRRAIETGVPSIAVAVAKDGRIVWEEGFGMADRERNVA